MIQIAIFEFFTTINKDTILLISYQYPINFYPIFCISLTYISLEENFVAINTI